MKIKEHGVKEKIVRAYLSDNGYDGILLSRRDSFAWFTCGGNNSVFQFTERGVADLLITKDSKLAIVSEVERYRILDEELNGLGFEAVNVDWFSDRDKIIAKLTADKHIVSDSDTSGLPNVFESFKALRYSLMEEEIVRLRELCAYTSLAVYETCTDIKRGDSEHEISANLAGKLMKHGIRTPVCMVAADDRIKKYRHPMPNGRRVEKYALVVVGAEKNGLFASLSRMVSFGKPQPEIRVKHDVCMIIDANMIVNTVVGAKVADILNAGIAAYGKAGYPDEWRSHHQGGATGYHAREYLATFESTETVLNNQAFSWNPTIRGTKCEDTYLIDSNGQNILTAIDRWPMKEVKTNSCIVKRPDIMIM